MKNTNSREKIWLEPIEHFCMVVWRELIEKLTLTILLNFSVLNFVFIFDLIFIYIHLNKHLTAGKKASYIPINPIKMTKLYISCWNYFLCSVTFTYYNSIMVWNSFLIFALFRPAEFTTNRRETIIFWISLNSLL